MTPKGTHPRGNEPPALPSERHVQHSGKALAIAVIGLMVGGAALIIANYLDWLPGEPSNAWLGGGLLTVLAGLLLATRWR